MSKIESRPKTAGGISTPQTLAETGQDVNMSSTPVLLDGRRVDHVLVDDFLAPMDSASEVLVQLSSLFQQIEIALAETPLPTSRLKHLAGLGYYVSQDIANHVDCMHETCRDVHTPKLLEVLEARNG